MESINNIPHTPLDGPRPEFSISLHDGSDEQVSIIIVHNNKPAYLNICLQSIIVNSRNSNYEIVVVDNGSEQESQNLLDEVATEVKIIKNKKNLYWTAAANQGAAAADKASKYLIFLHADVVVLNPTWIEMLINVSESYEAGMVGLELHSYYINNQKVDFIPEWCLLMTRKCWEDIGPFPEVLPQIGPAFITTMRAQQKGHKPQVLNHAICHHYRVFGLDINEYGRLTDAAMAQIPKLMKESHYLTV